MRFRVTYPTGQTFCFDLPITTELRTVVGLSAAMADHRGQPSIEIEGVNR